MASIARRKVFPAAPIVLAIFLYVPLSNAQEIHIRALNANNGKPISNECLNVWSGTARGTHLVTQTNKQGTAFLQVQENEISTENGCPGWPTHASRGPGQLTIAGARYFACQEYGKITRGEAPVNSLTTMPAYRIAKILESGISAGNSCGKFRVDAKPGELILFMRPLHWWERMKR